MEITVQDKTPKKIKRTSILQQTAFWSEVKRKHGIETQAFDIKVKPEDVFIAPVNDELIVDDMLILLQDIGEDYKVGYVPYGPTLKPSEENQGLFLEELSESVRQYLPSKCLMLRFDLLWESQWASDGSCFNEDHEWIGLPPKPNQEFRLNFNTKKWNLKKANTNILPSDTIFIDLRKTKDRLLKDMKAKTRYNIRLSARRGVWVECAGMDQLDLWYDLYRDTCARNRIYLHDIGYFRSILDVNSRDIQSPAEVELLLARNHERILAAMFLVYSGRRATYLYGASSSVDRHLMATYALQWEALKRAKNKGCTEYDMFGVAPYPDPSHPLYGLYRFKKGFGGHIFHRMGCWDYPLDAENYERYRSLEMRNQGYHV